ncbi:hypothetical protein [Clostridium sp.]|uniref:hypothetical protein n=1 Tax=Clostridium sp. TaxID=1506 RepID=UPI003217324F
MVIEELKKDFLWQKYNIIPNTIYTIKTEDSCIFGKDLEEAIQILQNDGQEVEVQYKVNNFNNGQLVYSALILGRK